MRQALIVAAVSAVVVCASIAWAARGDGRRAVDDKSLPGLNARRWLPRHTIHRGANAQSLESELVLPVETARRSRAGNGPYAIMVTDHGEIELELLPQAAPKTVANFVNLSRTGFYDGTYAYRYVANFVVQGGGYYANQTSNITVPLEYKLPNEQWTVGLARGDTPDSGSSEWFINLVNNSAALAPGGSSKHGYCVFGKVVAGFQTVKALTMLPTFNSQTDGTTEFVKPWPLVRRIVIV